MDLKVGYASKYNVGFLCSEDNTAFFIKLGAETESMRGLLFCKYNSDGRCIIMVSIFLCASFTLTERCPPFGWKHSVSQAFGLYLQNMNSTYILQPS